MKQTCLSLCLSLLILFFSYLPNSTLTAGEGISKLPQRDNNSNTQILQELREIKTAIREGSISARDVLGIVIPVIVQSELKENKESLVAEEQKRIRYHIVNLTDFTVT